MAKFSEVPVGVEFMSDGHRYRKVSETKAHLDGRKDHAGPLRFKPDAEVTEPPNRQDEAQAAKAEQAKKEAKDAENKSAGEGPAVEKAAPEKAKKDK